jgi:hypothetical protein
MDKTSNSLDTNWEMSKVKIKQLGLGAFLEGRKEEIWRGGTGIID